MKTCIPINNQPADIREITDGYGNASNPTLDDLIARGRRIYQPATQPGIIASHWEDDGRVMRQVVDEAKTQEQLDQEASDAAIEAAAEAAAFNAALLAYQADLNNAERITKGLALAILDELNKINQRLRDFDAAVAAAVSLADLKTRVAALSAVPERTVAQLKTAIKTKVEGLP